MSDAKVGRKLIVKKSSDAALVAKVNVKKPVKKTSSTTTATTGDATKVTAKAPTIQVSRLIINASMGYCRQSTRPTTHWRPRLTWIRTCTSIQNCAIRYRNCTKKLRNALRFGGKFEFHIFDFAERRTRSIEGAIGRHDYARATTQSTHAIPYAVVQTGECTVM